MVNKIDKTIKLLNLLDVKGYENCAIVVACINELNQMKEAISRGNTVDESRAN